jgi:hypothetical protein
MFDPVPVSSSRLLPSLLSSLGSRPRFPLTWSLSRDLAVDRCKAEHQIGAFHPPDSSHPVPPVFDGWPRPKIVKPASWAGIGPAAVSIIVMPLFALGQGPRGTLNNRVDPKSNSGIGSPNSDGDSMTASADNPRVSSGHRAGAAGSLKRFACLFSIVGILLVGCGSGGGGSSKPLSHQQLVSQANAACKQANNQFAALPRITTLAGVSSFAASAQPIAQDLQSKLQALQPPQKDQSAFSSLLSAFKAQIAELPALRAAAEAGNQQQAQKIANDLDASAFNTDASDLGLTECAKNVQPQG